MANRSPYYIAFALHICSFILLSIAYGTGYWYKADTRNINKSRQFTRLGNVYLCFCNIHTLHLLRACRLCYSFKGKNRHFGHLQVYSYMTPYMLKPSHQSNALLWPSSFSLGRGTLLFPRKSFISSILEKRCPVGRAAWQSFLTPSSHTVPSVYCEFFHVQVYGKPVLMAMNIHLTT